MWTQRQSIWTVFFSFPNLRQYLDVWFPNKPFFGHPIHQYCYVAIFVFAMQLCHGPQMLIQRWQTTVQSTFRLIFCYFMTYGVLLHIQFFFFTYETKKFFTKNHDVEKSIILSSVEKSFLLIFLIVWSRHYIHFDKQLQTTTMLKKNSLRQL